MPEPGATGGILLVLAIVVPLAGVLLAFGAGGRHVERIALTTMLLALAIAVALRRSPAGGPGLRSRSGSFCCRSGAH